MAKRPDEIDDLNIDDLDFELNDDTGYDDINDASGAKPPDRKPADNFVVGVGDAIKRVKFDTTSINNSVSDSFPKTAGLISEATSTLGDIQRLRNDVVKDLQPTINQMRITGRRFLPRVKNLLPESVYDKIYEKLSPDETEGPISADKLKDQVREDTITEQLGAIFKATQEQSRVDAQQNKADGMMQQALGATRHKELAQLISDIRQYSYAGLQYNQTVSRGYMMKSLELKYRHLFVAKDTLAVIKTVAQILDHKLENIKHNTALPDFVKKRSSEMFHEIQKQALMGKATETIGDYAKNFSARLRKNISDKTKDFASSFKSGLGDAASGLDVWMDMDEMEQEFNGKVPASRKAGNMVGNFAMTRLGKTAIGKGAKALGQYGGDIENMANDFKNNAAYRLNDKMRNSDNSLVQWLYENIIPQQEQERGGADRLLAKHATEEVPFDVLTRRSIVEIIPGYLAKILKQATDIATGSNDTGELIFDPESEDFISTDQFQKNITDKYFGTADTRSDQMQRGISQMLASFSMHGGDQQEFFNALPNIVKFLSNSAKHGQMLDPKEIAKIASGEWSDNDYGRWAFKDIEGAQNIAKLIQQSLYNSEGQLNKDAKNDLGAFIRGLGEDRDKEMMSHLDQAGALGMRRQYNFLFDDKGELDHKKLRAMYNDVNLDRLGSLSAEEANYYKNRYVKNQEDRFLHGNAEDTSRVEQDYSTDQSRMGFDIRAQMFADPEGKFSPIPTGSRESIVNKILSKDKVQEIVDLAKSKKLSASEFAKRISSYSTDTQVKLVDLYNTYYSDTSLKDTVSSVKTKAEETFVDAKGNLTKLGEAFKDALENAGLQTSDRFSKDEMHISGPGVYVQGSETELHIPADDTSDYWGNMKFTVTDPQLTALRELTDIVGSIMELQGQFLPNLEVIKAVGASSAGIDIGEPSKPSILRRGARMASSPFRAAWNMGAKSIQASFDISRNLAVGATTFAKNMAGGVGAGAGMAARGIGKAIGGTFGLYGGMLQGTGNAIRNFFSSGGLTEVEPFINVYRKDEVDAGNPLLSIRKQQAGVQFASGEALEDSYSISEPVFDSKTGEVLITEEDIKHGLVDHENKPLGHVVKVGDGGSVKKAIMSPIKAMSSLAGGLMGKIPGMAGGIGQMYKSMFDMTIGGISGLGRIVGNKLGMNGSIKMKDKELLQEMITDHLESIYTLLDERMPKQEKIAGDTDSDGDRDGSYQDYVSKAKDKIAKTKGSTKAIGSKVAGAAGSATAAMSSLMQRSKDRTEEDDGDSDGLSFTEMLGGGVAAKGAWNWLKGKVAKKGAAKAAEKLAGKEATEVVEKTALKKGGSIAAKIGGKYGAKLAAKAAGKGASKLIPGAGILVGAGFAINRLIKGDYVGAGLELASGVVGGLTSWTGLGAAASIAIEGALVAKDIAHLHIDDTPLTQAMMNARLNAYGIGNNPKMHAAVRELEEWVYELMDRSTDKDDYGDMADHTDEIREKSALLGFDPNNKDEVSYFNAWLKKRFVPAFWLYIIGLDQVYDKDYYEQDELTPEQVKQFIAAYKNKWPNEIGSAGAKLVPTRSGMTSVLTGRNTPKVKLAPTYVETEENKKSPVSGTKPNATTAPGTSTPKAAADIVSAMHNGELGSLSAKFESSRQGSSAIGYDRTGGTSYGKYQIATKTGTFDKFLAWCETQPGGAEVAARLRAAGEANTGFKGGSVPEEWKKLVREGAMGDLEHEFIKATHYEPALKDITNAEFKKKIMGSKAFQNVLWSTAVQHGASGAAKIFNSAYSPELSDEGIIRRIYKIRATRFGSSDYRTRRSVFRRFDEEREIALAAVKKTDTIRQDIGTSTMVADASPEVSGIPSEQPSGTQVPNSAMAARNLADTEKRQQQVVASAKQEQPAINVSTEPDKKQHTLIAEQTDVMRDVADNIAKMNDQLKKSFGNGEVFRSMDGKLASLNDKDPVVVSAAPNVAQLPPRRQQTQPKGIDLSKQYREGA